MILTFATINRHSAARPAFVPTMVFYVGLSDRLGLFGILAALADWGSSAALISPLTGKLTPILGAVVVTAAGIYQLTPLKSVCLTHCRSPFDFVLNHWRTGTAGALRMGRSTGFIALGCCWFLMALLFAPGS